MSEKLPVNSFEWIEDISQFNEDFIKSYNEENHEENFLGVDVHPLDPAKFLAAPGLAWQAALKRLK